MMIGIYVVRCEFTKLKRRKITLMLIVLSCFFPLIVVMTTKNGMSGDLSTHYLKMRFDLSFTMTQGYGLVFLAPCLIGMLATILFFMERDNDTFKNIKTVPVTITKMILAKICVLFIYGTLFSLTSVSFTIFFSWILKVGIIYDLAYKLGFSIIFGLVITIASLPIVVIIVYFNKSYLVSTLLAFFYSILNWGIIGLFETMAVKGTAKFLNLFPVICAMDWTSGKLVDHVIKDNLSKEAYIMFPSDLYAFLVLGVTLFLVFSIFNALLSICFNAFLGFSGMNIHMMLMSAAQIIVSDILVYISVLPIIIVCAFAEGKSLLGVAVAFIYGYFATMEGSMLNWFPIKAAMILVDPKCGSEYGITYKIPPAAMSIIGVLVVSILLFQMLNRTKKNVYMKSKRKVKVKQTRRKGW